MQRWTKKLSAENFLAGCADCLWMQHETYCGSKCVIVCKILYADFDSCCPVAQVWILSVPWKSGQSDQSLTWPKHKYKKNCGCDFLCFLWLDIRIPETTSNMGLNIHLNNVQWQTNAPFPAECKHSYLCTLLRVSGILHYRILRSCSLPSAVWPMSTKRGK